LTASLRMTDSSDLDDSDLLPDGDAAPDRPKSITLKDVARLAGLSPITVSRALHNPKLVRPETVERAKEAAAAIGYIPNMLAGGLTTRRSQLIAAIVPQLSNSMFAETVQGLNDELSAHGYQLLLSVSNYSRQKEEDLLSAILSRQPDGIVLTGINHHPSVRKKLLATGVPVVEAWDLTPSPIDMSIGFSHERIGEKVAQFLLDKGYRRFASVCARDERANRRRLALEAELLRHGVEPVATYMATPPTTLALGREGLRAILGGGHDPDVVVCSSDVLAQGVLIEAHAQGIAVPERFGLMGFGDFDFAAHTYPPISSVHIDKRAIGVRAAKSLIARIEGKRLKDSVIDVGFHLVERETTRSLP
jgi:LacI family transcriptional regulator, gluconate utilization system Gnt-I transcriptional repressor